MTVTVTCTRGLFDKLKASTGEWVTLTGEDLNFIYLAQGEGMEYTDLTMFDIPKLKKRDFSTWDKFEYWCENIRLKLMWRLVDQDDPKFWEIYDSGDPASYFGSPDVAVKKIMDVMTDPNDPENEPISVVTIVCDGESLVLVYPPPADGWALGHCNSVAVVSSIEDLDEGWGLYKLQSK
jgi:hypothetical protein